MKGCGRRKVKKSEQKGRRRGQRKNETWKDPEKRNPESEERHRARDLCPQGLGRPPHLRMGGAVVLGSPDPPGLYPQPLLVLASRPPASPPPPGQRTTSHRSHGSSISPGTQLLPLRAALLALAQQFRSEVTSSVSHLADLFLVQAAQQRRAAPPAAPGLPLTARFHPSRSDVWFLVSLAPAGQFPFCFLPRKTPTPMWF